jgi:hypothetical protein
MKQIRLQKKANVFKYNGKFKYLIVYDEGSGRKDRYTLLAGHEDDSVTIGRELELKWVRELIQKYEEIAPDYWMGAREDIIDCMNKISTKIKTRKS